MKHIWIIFLFLTLSILFPLGAQQKPSKQWLDQKFSMFVHFGLYSVYGGVYEGKPVTRGYSEQIQSFAGIFSDWYADQAGSFNPTKWNPDSVVALAKAAGMKSIVFTAKHHDGFCMYHSSYTDFNIVDATPYGKDIMKELAKACARGGIGFSVYFSLIDWHFPQAYPISSHNADPLTPEHYAFNLKQVEEIMENYGPISEIWFDMGSLTPQQSKGLYDLVNRLQPACMVSGRLGNNYVDFAVMADNEYPDYEIGVPWQTAASIFPETWGYRSWQKRENLPQKIDEKIASLVQVISRGGNYLLNIGPRGDGSIVEYERDVLLGMGRWISINAEAIYGTKANPLNHPFEWGEATTKGNDLYLFVKREFLGTRIQVPRVQKNDVLVSELQDGGICNAGWLGKKTPPALLIDVPKNDGEFRYVVLKVHFADTLNIVPPEILSDKTTFDAANSTPRFGHSSLDYYGGYKSLIGYHWDFKSSRKNVAPEISFTDNEKGKTILLDIDGNATRITLENARGQKVKVEAGAVKWGKVYEKSGQGVFGYIEEEGFPIVATDSTWSLIPGFVYGKEYETPLRQRGSRLVMQEMESSRAQTVAVEIGSGNAIYLLLNGEYITAHFSPERVHFQKEIVLLPLKKGKNQLLIKYYNRYEPELRYSIEPLTEWNVYNLPLPPVELSAGKIHRVSVRLNHPQSKVSPLRLNNLNIRFR